MDDVVYQCRQITERDIERLRKIELGMPVVADISRADLLLFCQAKPDESIVLAHARPHSVAPVHGDLQMGQRAPSTDRSAVVRAFVSRRTIRSDMAHVSGGAPVVQEVHPILGDQQKIIGSLCIETNSIEWERHLRRKKPFRAAVMQLQRMLIAGRLENAARLTPFGEHDGVVVVDTQKRITYASGVATNLYRKLGFMTELVGEFIQDMETDDDRLISRVLEEQSCLEEEVQEQQRIWVKKAIPLFSDGTESSLTWVPFRSVRARLAGVMMTIHDQTEERLREQELQAQATMVQEIHHRVKNNLQTIAALLRLESRRANSDETKQVLYESINRILSVAIVHEFLSRRDASFINLRDVAQRIIGQVREGLLDPEKKIEIELNGPSIYLSPQQTTACALSINELLQNAIEHGYADRSSGAIEINLTDQGDFVTIEVVDDGGGLPSDFNFDQDVSLGLRIVQSLATNDLKGQFELKNSGEGTSAIVEFPKKIVGGV
jgi:two-component system, sensor histidine kinase PdtaS